MTDKISIPAADSVKAIPSRLGAVHSEFGESWVYAMDEVFHQITSKDDLTRRQAYEFLIQLGQMLDANDGVISFMLEKHITDEFNKARKVA